METPAEAPRLPGALATALSVVDGAVESLVHVHDSASAAMLRDDEGARTLIRTAWATVRASAVASATPPEDRPAPPADLGREARAVLERYTAATSDLEPSVDSAVGIGVAAIGALVGLAALGVAALARIGDNLNAIEPQVADAVGELRNLAGSVESANQTGWGG